MSDAPETTEPAEKLPFVRGVKLAAMQAHRLGTISMAGVTLAAQIAKQADDAKFVGAEVAESPSLIGSSLFIAIRPSSLRGAPVFAEAGSATKQSRGLARVTVPLPWIAAPLRGSQ